MYFTHDNDEWPVDSLTYSESVQPHDVTSTEGAVPSIGANVAFAHWANVYALYREDVTFESNTYQVVEVGDASKAKSLSALSRLERFNFDYNWPSLDNLSGLVSIGAGRGLTFSVRSSVTAKYNKEVRALPPLWGNGWLRLKELCSAFEIHSRGNENVFELNENRPVWDLQDDHVISADISLVSADVVDEINVASYEYNNYRNKTTEVFPKFSTDPGYSSITADAGETSDTELQLDFLMDPGQQLAQPVCLDFVENKEYTTPVYSVVGNDDLPIKPKQWADFGGNVSVRVKEDDPSVLVVSVTGAMLEHLAPFTVAMSSGDGHNYNSLHVIARGVSRIRKVARLKTGVVNYGDAVRTAEFDNPFVCTPTTIANAYIDATRRYSGFTHTAVFNILNEKIMPRVGDYVRYNGHVWRIDSSSEANGATTTMNCTEHTRIKDWNETLGTMTFKDFNAKFAGKTINEFDARILL